jgi:xanthine dehydrogenase accessory factor
MPVDKEMELWRNARSSLEKGEECVLLAVVHSEGSSPGRAGFKALITSSGTLLGSIGGGSMEHKLVELARSRMTGPHNFPILKRQIHRADEPVDRSGMICSGEQTVAFIHLGEHARSTLQRILDHLEHNIPIGIRLGPEGLRTGDIPDPGRHRSFQVRSEADWIYDERLGIEQRIVILGAGHVGLALSRTMHQLGFHVHLMDDRADLNTMAANEWAHERSVVDYGRIADKITDDPELYVVLVSFGYRTDDILVRQLIRKRFKYLGMMGSAEKIKTLFDGLRTDGFPEEAIARVKAPIGLPIGSKTPEEIAVSIAAEIIGVKNKS